MDSIDSIRQMMADSQFYEAQKKAEVLLAIEDPSSRLELLSVYLEILDHLKKPFNPDLIIELSEKLSTTEPAKAWNWLMRLSGQELERNFIRIQLLRLRILEAKGLTQDLYENLSALQLYLYENAIPSVPQEVMILTGKYFKKDFKLQLQRLGLLLQAQDLVQAESLLKQLITSSVQKSSRKGLKEKYQAISEILSPYSNKNHFSIYMNFCRLMAQGISEKSDYKRIAEMVIYFDDFSMQVQLLNLLNSWGLDEISADYAQDVRSNGEYNFVYIDKYYPELKKFFARTRTQASAAKVEALEVDLKLEENTNSVEPAAVRTDLEFFEEESHLLHLLKHQSFSVSELNELIVSFIQANYIKVALKASSLALDQASDPHNWLKSCYLKLTCLLKLNDFRAALDLSLEALGKCSSKDDILSFLYLQGEALIKLGDKEAARRVLRKIIDIDARYRLARERLEKLNEI